MLFLLLLSFATPSSAGKCSKIRGVRPPVGPFYDIQLQTTNVWTQMYDNFEGDGFSVAFNNINELSMVSIRQAPRKHKYVVMLQYPSGDVLFWLDAGDACIGVAGGDQVPFPTGVRVAQVKGS
jgi:hypothetical protein